MLENHVTELAAAGIDYADAMSRLDGHAALYERLVRLFLTADDHLAGLNTAMEQGDVEVALREAHTLKGTAGNLSFSALYQAACLLHQALCEGRRVDADSLWGDVQSEYARVRGTLGRLL